MSETMAADIVRNMYRDIAVAAFLNAASRHKERS